MAVYGGECVTDDSMEYATPEVNLSDAEESTAQPTTIQQVTFQTFIEYDENPESERSDEVTENPPPVEQGKYFKANWAIISITLSFACYTQLVILKYF